MSTEDMDDIFKFAELLQNVIIETYSEHGIMLPAKRYIAIGGIGDTVHDCEQLSISWEQSYTGLPGEQSEELSPCDGPVSSVYVVELVRNIPIENSGGQKRQARSTSAANMPPVDIQSRTETAKIQMRDAYLLRMAAMNASVESSSILDGALVDVSAGQPLGAYQGILMTVAIPV